MWYIMLLYHERATDKEILSMDFNGYVGLLWPVPRIKKRISPPNISNSLDLALKSSKRTLAIITVVDHEIKIPPRFLELIRRLHFHQPAYRKDNGPEVADDLRCAIGCSGRNGRQLTLAAGMGVRRG